MDSCSFIEKQPEESIGCAVNLNHRSLQKKRKNNQALLVRNKCNLEKELELVTRKSLNGVIAACVAFMEMPAMDHPSVDIWISLIG